MREDKREGKGGEAAGTHPSPFSLPPSSPFWGDMPPPPPLILLILNFTHTRSNLAFAALPMRADTGITEAQYG